MTPHPHSEGLRFFGAMTASISHEIKNRMAVINEQAGLLEDLVAMAARGRPMDPERLTRLADNLKTQVAMADDILRTMNRFAHSVDTLWREVDIADIPPLSAALSRRLASGRNLSVEVVPAEAPARAETAPFLLMNLIWACIEGLMAAGLENAAVAIETAPIGNGARMTLTAPVPAGTWTDLIAAEPAAELVAALGVAAAVSADGQALTLELPGVGG